MNEELKATLQAQAIQIEEGLRKLSEAKAKDEADRASIDARLTELSNKQAEMGRKFLTIAQESQRKEGAGEAALGVGDQLIRCSAYGDLMSGRTTKATFAVAKLAAVKTPDGAVEPHVIQGVNGAPALRPVVSAAFPHVPTVSDAIKGICEKSFTNSAAEAAEATQKAESDITLEARTANVVTIAHFIRVTKQLAADAPALAAYINARMAYGLERRVDSQLINGDGEGENLSGIFKTGNFTAHGFTKTNMPEGSTILDLIRRSAAVIGKNGYFATTLFLNPMDFDALRGMKDNNGAYLMGSPLQGGAEIRPWGLSVVASPVVPEGKFMVADTAMGATVYDRSAPVVEMFEQDSDNVQKNLYTVRAEQRMAFMIDSVNCFVGGDLKLTD